MASVVCSSATYLANPSVSGLLSRSVRPRRTSSGRSQRHGRDAMQADGELCSSSNGGGREGVRQSSRVVSWRKRCRAPGARWGSEGGTSGGGIGMSPKKQPDRTPEDNKQQQHKQASNQLMDRERARKKGSKRMLAEGGGCGGGGDGDGGVPGSSGQAGWKGRVDGRSDPHAQCTHIRVKERPSSAHLLGPLLIPPSPARPPAHHPLHHRSLHMHSTELLAVTLRRPRILGPPVCCSSPSTSPWRTHEEIPAGGADSVGRAAPCIRGPLGSRARRTCSRTRRYHSCPRTVHPPARCILPLRPPHCASPRLDDHVIAVLFACRRRPGDEAGHEQPRTRETTTSSSEHDGLTRSPAQASRLKRTGWGRSLRQIDRPRRRRLGRRLSHAQGLSAAPHCRCNVLARIRCRRQLLL